MSKHKTSDKYFEITEKQRLLNQELALLFRGQNITKFQMTSYGNSIATGYSMVRPTKPLLLRNQTIEKIMRANGIMLCRYHFSRAQNNNDARLFDYLIRNVRLSDIYKMNRNDFGTGPTSMPTFGFKRRHQEGKGLSKEELDYYYPLEVEDDRTIQDVFFETDSSLANIVVYNGCTGAFLNNCTRNRKLHFMQGIQEDTISLEAILSYIQNHNRIGKSNTQVYLCGVPNFLGIYLSEVINGRLKRIAKKYANTIYVEPVKSRLLYTSIGSKKHQFDVHYDELEYLELNNHILQSIEKNYTTTAAMIDIDRKFLSLNKQLEFQTSSIVSDEDYAYNKMSAVWKKATRKVANSIERKNLKNRLSHYLSTLFTQDFFYLGHNNIEKLLAKLPVDEEKTGDATKKLQRTTPNW